MDSDLWISRLIAAKRQYAIQHQHNTNSLSDRLSVDEFELEEEVQPDFCCPYCYEDHDIVSLCSHLEEEHPFESKGAVCPICSVNVSKDMLNHITAQHGYLFKVQRRRMLRKFAVPSSQTLSFLGRDIREAHLQVLLGNRSSSGSAATTAPDPFLSSLLLNFPTSEAEETSKISISNADESFMKTEPSLPHWKASFDSSLTSEEREKRVKQATARATFAQDLVSSAMFGDL